MVLGIAVCGVILVRVGSEPSPDPAEEGFFVVWKQECIFCRWPVWGVFKNGGMCGWKFAPG